MEYFPAPLEKLVEQTILLMDEELAANNPKNDYFKAVKEEILEYEKNIQEYKVDKAINHIGRFD